MHKLMRICQVWVDNRGIKSLRVAKDYCLEVFCSTIGNLLTLRYHQDSFMDESQVENILIGEFFYVEYKKEINLFGILEIELSQLNDGKGQNCNYILFQIILQMLRDLLLRVYSQIEGAVSELDLQFLDLHAEMDSLKEKNHWYSIYREYQSRQLSKTLSELLYNSNVKFIAYNVKVQEKINHILTMTDKIDQMTSNRS